VHKVTKLVLSDLEFSGRKLEFISAFSEAEAKSILLERDDIAVILLDVVMEQENSGLLLTRYIREDIKNNLIRIILRTGQPGQAPEKRVIVEYDINDYKSKTELTTERLYSTVITALRSYRDIITIEKNKKALERIIEATAHIFEVRSLQNFVAGILDQFTSILRYSDNAFYCQTSGLTAINRNGHPVILAATGKYGESTINTRVEEVLEPKQYELLTRAFAEKRNIYDEYHYIAFFKTQNNSENIIYLERNEALQEWERDMIDIFCTNVSIAFENIYLNQELENLVDNRTRQLKHANDELNIKNMTFERELFMARSVQQIIIPRTFPKSEYFEIGGRYHPMQNLGGDYYDVFPFTDNSMGIAIVDVSGHGISAALITTMAKMSFANLAKPHNPPFYVLDEINASLLKTVGGAGMFLTAFYGIIDLSINELIYSNGGHNEVLLLHKDGTYTELCSLNPIVGMFPEEEYVSSSCPIHPGDILILYTDGIVESKDKKGNFLGKPQLMEILKENCELSPDDLSEFVLQKIYDYTGNSEPEDDLSILITRIL
jgi:serine phosphatase RsbU (regulator of sigma subunit)/CheY-like chemotaxis protein